MIFLLREIEGQLVPKLLLSQRELQRLKPHSQEGSEHLIDLDRFTQIPGTGSLHGMGNQGATDKKLLLQTDVPAPITIFSTPTNAG